MTTPPPSFPVLDLTECPMPYAVAFNGAQGTLQTVTGAGMILGFTARETTGTGAASGTIIDGLDSSNDEIAGFSMAANGFASFGPGFPGIPFYRGIRVQHASGSYDGGIVYVLFPDSSLSR